MGHKCSQCPSRKLSQLRPATAGTIIMHGPQRTGELALSLSCRVLRGWHSCNQACSKVVKAMWAIALKQSTVGVSLVGTAVWTSSLEFGVLGCCCCCCCCCCLDSNTIPSKMAAQE